MCSDSHLVFFIRQLWYNRLSPLPLQVFFVVATFNKSAHGAEGPVVIVVSVGEEAVSVCPKDHPPVDNSLPCRVVNECRRSK